MYRIFSVISTLVALAFFTTAAHATLKTVKITDTIYAFVGEKQQRSPKNLANNATFGAVITSDGIVLIDPGGSWNGAKALHEAIRAVSDKPVKFVINSGGQDHRWLGNGYWKKQGAKIIASENAVQDHKDRGSLQMTMLTNLLGDKLKGTEPVTANITFKTNHTLTVGGRTFEINHVGQAHTPGDSFIWLKDAGVMFTGDIVYTERLLGIGSFSNAKSWIATFEAMAKFNPKHIVPGHGAPTTLARARTETYDYLVNLRTQMAAHIENGGDIIGSVKVDQSAFKHLGQFKALAGRNAQAVFQQMEWE